MASPSSGTAPRSAATPRLTRRAPRPTCSRGLRCGVHGSNGVAERWIGSARRELLDHVVVCNEHHLQRLLRDSVAYYHDDRTHLGLAKATPASRPPQVRPAGSAAVVSLPRLGGLYHRYEWRAVA